MLVDPSSLVNTLDNINEKLLFDEPITQEAGLEASRWIISRQGMKGAYRTMFAPTQADFEGGIHSFTGEKLVSASARHIMGQEAARAIWQLGNFDPVIRESYDRATSWMRENLEIQQSGTFCCGRCTIAAWRHLWVGDFKHKEALMSRGLQMLKNNRIGDGTWRRFPFHYAIYTLLEIELEPALAELEYARPHLERALKRTTTGTFSKRRKKIFEEALQRIN